MPEAVNRPTTLSGNTLRGIWPALITPWRDDGELDERRFADEIRAYRRKTPRSRRTRNAREGGHIVCRLARRTAPVQPL